MNETILPSSPVYILYYEAGPSFEIETSKVTHIKCMHRDIFKHQVCYLPSWNVPHQKLAQIPEFPLIVALDA